MTWSRWTFLAAMVIVIALPVSAAAHGGRPQTYDLLFTSDAPDVLVAAATFGLIVSEDGGASWRWLCVQVMPDARGGELHSVVLLRGGVLLASGDFGLVRGDMHACGAWEYSPELLRDRFVADVIRAPGSETEAIVVTSDAGVENRLYRIIDSGTSGRIEGASLPMGFLPERVRFAPSDSQTIYVSGFYRVMGSAEPRPALQVSRDGGDTWTEQAFTFEGTERSLHVLGVDPTRPERVFLLARGDATDRVRLSGDAGATSADLLVTSAAPGAAERPYAFAFAQDGFAWLGNTRAGLYTADGSAVRLVNKFLALACVVPRGDDVWLCADGFPDMEGDGFALATTPPSPMRYEPRPRMLLPEVTRRTCASAERCDVWWPDFLADVGRSSEIPDAGLSPPDAGAIDASVRADGASPAIDATSSRDAGSGTGGGCTAGRRGRGDGIATVLLLTALLARRRRRPLARTTRQSGV